MARTSRGLRKAATPALPKGVKPATWVPLLVIPSAGHNAKMDGTAGANLRRRTVVGSEQAVTLRYQPCCEEHKGQITVDALITEFQLQGLCTRLTQHLGHGALLPRQAKVEWAECTEKAPCADCLEAIPEQDREAWLDAKRRLAGG